MSVNKTKAAEELGLALVKLRQDAGLTVRDMAARLENVSPANISNWSNGSRLIPMNRLVEILDEFEVHGDERERFLGLRRQADGPGELAAGVPSIGPLLKQLIEHESAARLIKTFALGTLPGLLQTREYATAVLGGGPDTAVRVALRMGRQDILTRDHNPTHFAALIDSEALTRPIGPKDVIARQLRHLLAMAKRPNVTIQIVPSTLPGWHPGLTGSFMLIEFPQAKPIVHVEHYRASAFLWDEADVAAYTEAAEEIRKKAMTPERTAEAIAELLSGLE
jgi:hypothetical protein